ncbi:hypothetical protein IH575_04300 [Candidatus Dojkabacteria bacterium]|nr:hypothetical protein [Candidatus Dojkabacteria bacterium]
MTVPIIGIDAEWQSGPQGNSALSYQWYGIDGDTSWSGIHLPNLNQPEKKKRLKLHQWVSQTLQDQYKGRQWPDRVVLASHFTPAELSVIKDFGDLKRRVEIIQGTSFVTLFNPIALRCYDRSKNVHGVRAYLTDTMLLAPEDGKKLEVLGGILGIKKLDLPKGYDKDNMLRLRNERPEDFKDYAIRDAEIAARYLERIQKECGDLGLDNYRPITVGGLAVRTFTNRLREARRTYDDIMGVERASRRTGPRQSAATRTYRNKLVAKKEKDAIDCYHGGRNECFLFGPFNETFTDYDLEGAYSTALVAVVEPDFDNLKETKNLEDFRLDQMGYALARWKFPESVRFPCLFVRDDNGHGLIYVHEGEENVTSPEIDLARRMGAEIEIISGVVVPPKKDGV